MFKKQSFWLQSVILGTAKRASITKLAFSIPSLFQNTFLMAENELHFVKSWDTPVNGLLNWSPNSNNEEFRELTSTSQDKNYILAVLKNNVGKKQVKIFKVLREKKATNLEFHTLRNYPSKVQESWVGWHVPVIPALRLRQEDRHDLRPAWTTQ